jgi:hypothetical protein
LLRARRVFSVGEASEHPERAMTTPLLVGLLLAASPAEPAPQPAPAAGAPAPQPGPAAAPGPATAGQPAGPAGPVALATADDARGMCEALAPSDRLRFGGSALERGEAEARHDVAREGALAGRYQVVVPATQLRFSPYSADEGVLSLFRHAVPAGADGAVRLHVVEDAGLPVQVDLAAARRILAAQAERKLALEVTFVPAEEDEAPCFHVPGAAAYTVAAEPVAWRYLADGQVLARGGQGADRPLVSARSGARPRVRLGHPVGEDGAAPVPVDPRQGELEGCYAAALERDPYLDGALVADLAAGRQERVRIAADSVGSDELAGCVRGALARVELRGGGRAFLPIHFVLEPPDAGGAAGQ